MVLEMAPGGIFSFPRDSLAFQSLGPQALEAIQAVKKRKLKIGIRYTKKPWHIWPKQLKIVDISPSLC